MQLVVFCEGLADFMLAADLVDRVLRERGPVWIGHTLEATPDAIRTWLGDNEGRPYFDLHTLYRYAHDRGVRIPHGHFDGRPGAAGALMARTVFHLARRLAQESGEIAAAILLWDMDDDADRRMAGVAQARDEASRWAPFQIVIGLPNAMREAWVLTGFEAANASEKHLIDELRRELGFWPNEMAHLLHANDETAKRSPKRVLRALTLGDSTREAACWSSTPLEALRARSANTNLAEFLAEVEERLVSQFGRA